MKEKNKNMKKKIFILTLCFIFPLLFVGCSNESNTDAQSNPSATHSGSKETQKNSYKQISGADAYALMQSESNYIIIDARTQEEFDQGHIEVVCVADKTQNCIVAANRKMDFNALLFKPADKMITLFNCCVGL